LHISTHKHQKNQKMQFFGFIFFETKFH